MPSSSPLTGPRPSQTRSILDRIALWFTFGVSAATVMLIAVGGTISALGDFRDRSFRGSLPVSTRTKLPKDALMGSADVTGGFDSARVTVTGLSAETSGWLLSSALAWTLLGVIIVGTIAYLAWRMLESKPFAASLTTTVLIAGVAVSIGNIVAQLLNALASWHVAGELNNPQSWFWQYVSPVDLAPIALGFVLILVGVAFKHGERLQRDTEGLV